MTRSPSLRRALLPAIASLVVACGGGGGAPKVPLSQAPTDSNKKAMEAAHALIGPEAQAALDSGNALMYKAKADSAKPEMRKDDYARALVYYRRAAELAPQHSAPLFGIQMIAAATGNKVLQDSALAQIRLRTGDLTPLDSNAHAAAAAPHSMSDSALKALRAKMKKGEKIS